MLSIIKGLCTVVEYFALASSAICTFTSKVLKVFTKQIQKDWYEKYGNKVIGFETLIEKPRTGELCKKAGWTQIGETIGYTCKRTAGKGTDSWSGRRVWNTNKETLRPKIVMVKRV